MLRTKVKNPRVEVENLYDNKKIDLFLCHWSSRLSSDGDVRRKSAAEVVYSSAKELMDNGRDVIIMGDFNDNPYDESILRCLNATRCHDSVKRYPTEFFYNPFWRSMVSESKYNHLSGASSFRSGSYKYKQPLGSLWHSYDQIMLSGSFLGGGYWHLNESETKVLAARNFLSDFESKSNIIDHLPIVCEITRP